MKRSLKIPLKVNPGKTKSGARYTKLSAGIVAGRVMFVVSPPWKRAAESNVEREFAISNENPSGQLWADFGQVRHQQKRLCPCTDWTAYHHTDSISSLGCKK